VHDLWAVNQATVTAPSGTKPINFVGPHTSRSNLLLMFRLKRCILMHPGGTCEPTHLCFPMWGPPVRGQHQSTWTHLPQGFRNASVIFGTALTSDLWAYPAEEAGCTLLQYVDDLLLTAANHQDGLKGTELLLHLLRKAGYKVSQKKAQICQSQAKYLGFHISQGQQNLSAERKQAVCSIPTPTTRRLIHEFLGMAGTARFGYLIFHY
jgi:hypothetical protein